MFFIFSPYKRLEASTFSKKKAPLFLLRSLPTSPANPFFLSHNPVFIFPVRCDLWLPLRAVAPHDDNSFDAIKLAVTYYSEDCVAQG